MSNETLEEKVDRLESYIHQLRDYIVAPDQFALWDWSMSHRLNRSEIRGLIDLAKEFDSKMKEEKEENYPSLEEFKSRIEKIVYNGEREGFTIVVTHLFLTSFLQNLAKMGPCKTLTGHYLGLLNR